MKIKKTLGTTAKLGVLAAIVAGTAASASTLGSVNQPTLAEGQTTLTGCVAKTGGANVTFGPNQNDFPAPHQTVRSVTVSNLSDACNGKYVQISLLGNSAGDTTQTSHFLNWSSSSLNANTNCDFTSFGPNGSTSDVVTNGSVTVLQCLSSGTPVTVAQVTGVNILATNSTT